MYIPSAAPDIESMSSQDVLNYLQRELDIISQAFLLVQDGQAIEMRTVAPFRKLDGMLVYADGTLWNPGSGKGYYSWNGAAWVALHT